MKLWFKAKDYGWGWVPCSWEGWTAMGLYTALFSAPLVLFMNFAYSRPSSIVPWTAAFFSWNLLLMGALIWLCYAKGEKPEWRWGKKDAEVPLNDFEQLFSKAMKDPSAREGFYLAFLHTELYVSGRFRGPGEADLQYYDIAGEKILPVFSHPERLKKVLGADANILNFKGLDLIKNVAPAQPYALNPYSEFGREFDAAELAEILKKAD